MKQLISLFWILVSAISIAQTPNNCNEYTTVGTSSSNYNPGTDPGCNSNVSGTVSGPAAWSGLNCTGTLVSTVTGAPVTCLSLSYTAVNTNDFATITIDGGGSMTITGVNVDINGNVIGPYNCVGPYGDVSITICSTLPFTTVTLTNTGCSSGWVVNCSNQAGCGGGTGGNAGSDNLTTSLCGGTIDLNTLVTGDAGGTWQETTSSGQFNTGTGVFDANGLTGTYNFIYYFSGGGCGGSGGDTAHFTVSVGNGGSAGLDNSDIICNTPGTTLNLNTLLNGADPSGNWEEVTSSGQFTPGTGILNANGLTPGNYVFWYVVPAVSPCIQDTSEFTITVAPPPSADFEFEINGQSSASGATGGCMSYPVYFTDFSSISSPGSITSWSWDFGDGTFSSQQNPSHQYTAGGTYTIELTVVSNGGCSSVFTMPIDITQSPNMAINSSNPTCYQFSDGSITINTTGGSGTEVFTITDSLGNLLNVGNSNAANQLGEGWYYLTVDAGSGCSQIDSVFIDDPNQMSADIQVLDPACYGNPTGVAIVGFVYNATGDPANLSYYWNPNPGNQSGIGADSTGSMAEGQYTVTINDENGCSELFDFEINYPPPLVFSEIGAEPAYCRIYGYQNGNGVVYAAATGGTPDYTYQWINLANSNTTSNTTWAPLNPGSYQISVTDANGCLLTQVVELDSLNPIADFDAISSSFADPSIYEGTEPVTVTFENHSLYYANPNNPQADTTFYWNLNHDFVTWFVSHNVNEVIDTTYTGEEFYEVCLVAINKNGCTDTLCKDIMVHAIPLFETPNIFTPGGDNVNDEFTFEFKSQGVQNFSALIVDRWGKEVFEFNSIMDAWDGNNKSGTPCTDGVYFYKYEVTFTNGTSESGQGTVTLIREK
ncbi:MAG: gliding motility-associated C-terminal domain-containing protein [Crocinitomicaceae bacterium]